MAKRFATERQMNLALASANAAGIVRIDRSLSRRNHRLYREGRTYTAKIDLNPEDAIDGNFVEVYTIKDTWFTQKAWQLAFQEYLTATMKERRKASKSHLARWNDFRVNDGTGLAELLPRHFTRVGGVGNESAGEFVLSKVEDSAGAVRTWTWSDAPSAGEFAIMTEYDKAGNTNSQPTSPNVDQPYSEMDSDVSNNEWDDVTDSGNLPPYNQNGLDPTNPWNKVATLSCAPGRQKLSTGFFDAPCGIVMLRGLNSSGQQEVVLTVKNGDYKGVHAVRMYDSIKETSDSVVVN